MVVIVCPSARPDEGRESIEEVLRNLSKMTLNGSVVDKPPLP